MQSPGRPQVSPAAEAAAAAATRINGGGSSIETRVQYTHTRGPRKELARDPNGDRYEIVQQSVWGIQREEELRYRQEDRLQGTWRGSLKGETYI